LGVQNTVDTQYRLTLNGLQLLNQLLDHCGICKDRTVYPAFLVILLHHREIGGGGGDGDDKEDTSNRSYRKQPLYYSRITWCSTTTHSGVPRNFFREGVQQIQLRTEDRDDGDLGAVAP